MNRFLLLLLALVVLTGCDPATEPTPESHRMCVYQQPCGPIIMPPPLPTDSVPAS